MKKTLFALLALATMMPAMAVNLNWTLVYAYSNPYEDILHPSAEYTNPANYTLYLMAKENTDIASVKTMLEQTTFSDFTTTIASGDGIAFEYYNRGWKLLSMESYAETEFPITLDSNNIWGVCVLQDTDVVRFQVLQVEASDISRFTFDTASVAGSGYTSFSSGSVPEPATATLSLLALAGLATRRKRK